MISILEAALGHDPRYCPTCIADTPQGAEHDLNNCVCEACMLLSQKD